MSEPQNKGGILFHSQLGNKLKPKIVIFRPCSDVCHING